MGMIDTAKLMDKIKDPKKFAALQKKNDEAAVVMASLEDGIVVNKVSGPFDLDTSEIYGIAADFPWQLSEVG